MLETAVHDGLHDLGLEKQVAEGAGVDADVRAVTAGGACSSNIRVAVLGRAVSGRRVGRGGAIGGLDLLVRIVDEVFFAGRHGDGVVE